jgi:hypothetical protein
MDTHDEQIQSGYGQGLNPVAKTIPARIFEQEWIMAVVTKAGLANPTAGPENPTSGGDRTEMPNPQLDRETQHAREQERGDPATTALLRARDEGRDWPHMGTELQHSSASKSASHRSTELEEQRYRELNESNHKKNYQQW